MKSFENDNRVRGGIGCKVRIRRFRKHPLCEECLKQGIVTETKEIDHIVPLAFGGSDTDSNVQGLCVPCHIFKSAVENTTREGAASHPDWLEPSAIPVTVVCGPPCGGKMTYVEQHTARDDTVIGLDGIMRRIDSSYLHWQGMATPYLLNAAIRARNVMLGGLSRATEGRAWFIVAAPTQRERDWWKVKLGAEVVLLHPGIDECKRRAVARGTPQAVAGIEQWERKAKLPWLPPKKKFVKQRIGLDGWSE